MAPGSASSGTLKLGDRILACDGMELRGRKFVKVIKPQPTHTMRVLRCEGAHVDAPKAATEDAKHGKHKPATRPRTRGWFTRRHAPPASSPFGISAAKAPVWFGGLVETGSKGALHD